MSSCPGERTLRSIGTDALGDATYAAIEQHVEECPDCKQLLDCLAHRPTDGPFVLPDPKRLPRIPGFEIHHELGRGAMGVVYLATQTGLDRPVALKILSGAVGTDAIPTARRRWLREARAVSRIRHPNVVPLFDYGEEAGWFFLVLEYIPGGSLKERLSEPLPSRAAAGLVETIARAVGYIHGRGLLHLDLKPSNILLDCEDHTSWGRVVPRVSDFGLALFDNTDVSERSLAGPRGTPSYMAPEQTAASRGTIGPGADIYALGAILFELLTGRPPFRGTSTIETLDQVRGQEPVPPRRLNPAISRDVETICLTCLQKDPNRRYASAGTLAEDLRRWLDGRPIVARPVSSLEKAWKCCRRRPAVAALGASLALTLSAGFLSVFLLWRYGEAERIRAEADYEMGRAALAEILDLGEKSLMPTVVVTRDRVILSLQAARGRIVELADRRQNDPAIWNLLADVDLFLGRNLEYQRKYLEAEALYVNSLAHWDKILEMTPEQPHPRYRRWQTLICLGRVLELEGKLAQSMSLWERAIAVGESVLPTMRDPDFNSMAECRFGLAKLVDRQGDHERASTLLEAHLSMMSSVSTGAKAPGVSTWLLEIWNEVSRIHRESDQVDDEEWARRAVRLLHLSPNLADRVATKVSEAGSSLQDSLSQRASHQRGTDKLAEARRTADRMRAFGHLLVSAHPDQPAAHLALSLAFVQFAKNAWQINDRAAIEQNWKRALDEAHQALVLDPRDARARSEVTTLQRRLGDLLATRAEAVTPDRSVQSTIQP